MHESLVGPRALSPLTTTHMHIVMQTSPRPMHHSLLCCRSPQQQMPRTLKRVISAHAFAKELRACLGEESEREAAE